MYITLTPRPISSNSVLKPPSIKVMLIFPNQLDKLIQKY
jgi:hypothetical protein